MTEMSKKEIRNFLMQGTLTGKLATVKKDESPHVVPIWFILDDSTDNNSSGDIIFTTSSMSVKAKNIQRDNRVSICIDDQTPPFSFVTVYGTAKIKQYTQNPIDMNWVVNPKLLLDLPATPGAIGNGGKVVIGPDSNIYVTIGDVGINGHNTKAQNIQNGTEPDGTSGILRVNQDGRPITPVY